MSSRELGFVIRRNRETVYDLIADSLRETDSLRLKALQKRYVDVLNTCLLSITEQYNIDPEGKYVYFAIPKSDPDTYGLYNMKDCIVYVMANLQRRGWDDILFAPPNYLRIERTNPELELRERATDIILKREEEKTRKVLRGKGGEIVVCAREEEKGNGKALVVYSLTSQTKRKIIVRSGGGRAKDKTVRGVTKNPLGDPWG